jgi:hypothetical protein
MEYSGVSMGSLWKRVETDASYLKFGGDDVEV